MNRRYSPVTIRGNGVFLFKLDSGNDGRRTELWRELTRNTLHGLFPNDEV